MSKRYVFELIIEEGSDEFWKSIKDTGINEITDCIKEALDSVDFTVNHVEGVTLNLIQYSNK